MKKLLIVLALVVSSVSAYAMQFDTAAGKLDIYGSVRGKLYYEGISGAESAPNVDVEDRTRVLFGLQGNSRIGAKWTLGNIFAQYELGVRDQEVNGASTRLFFAGYKSDFGTITFGRMASIASTQEFYNRKLNEDDGLAGYGNLVQTRRQGVMYTIDGFSIALLSAEEDVAALAPAGTSYDELIPRVEVAYMLPFDFPAKVFGSFAQVAFNTTTDGGDDYDVTAYHVGALVKPQLTDTIYLTASAFYAVNAGAYNMAKVAGNNGRTYSNANLLPGTETEAFDKDATAIGGALAVGMAVTETATAELGFGYQMNSIDLDGAEDQSAMGVYLNCGFKVTPQFTVTPEIGYYDAGENYQEVKNGKAIQAGVQVRMDI